MSPERSHNILTRLIILCFLFQTGCYEHPTGVRSVVEQLRAGRQPTDKQLNMLADSNTLTSTHLLEIAELDVGTAFRIAILRGNRAEDFELLGTWLLSHASSKVTSDALR